MTFPSVVMGWSASTGPVNSTNGIQPNIVDNGPDVIDLANASANALKTSVGINPGRAWLHRPVAAVPGPSSLFLLGTGLALAARRLRRPLVVHQAAQALVAGAPQGEAPRVVVDYRRQRLA